MNQIPIMKETPTAVPNRFNNLRKITIVSLLVFCFVAIQAQENISVDIKKTLINNEILAVTTTLTNNNEGIIYIPIRSMTDDNGNNLDGGNTYLTLNAYDTNKKRVSMISRKIYYQYDPNYPLNYTKYRIVLKKGESIHKTVCVSSYQGVEGFLTADCTFKYLEIKLHIRYIYLSDNSLHTKELISNRLTFPVSQHILLINSTYPKSQGFNANCNNK